MDADLDFKKVDLYELFDILPEATESEVKKAYRKKALIYHPDKNPDKKANEIFQKLSKALEVLTDKEARASYDKILKAKKEREIKNRQLDAKRRKLKNDLDAKEKNAQEILIQNEEERLRHEIERIRKEGSKQLEEENFMLRMKLEEQRKSAAALMSANGSTIQSNRVKIRRKLSTIKLTESLIRQQLSSFGNILFMIVSKNGKSAVLEFEHYQSLKALELGCPSNFEVEILSTSQPTASTAGESVSKAAAASTTAAEKPSAEMPNMEDYEDFVFRQLQQAESNKRKNAEN